MFKMVFLLDFLGEIAIIDIMKTLLNLFRAYLTYTLIVWLFQTINAHADYSTVMQVYAPIYEELLKSIGNIWITIYFALIETLSYTINKGMHVILPRLIITLPMHIIAYKIGRKHGVIFAIIYHMGFNNLCYTQGQITCMLYVYIIGMMAYIKK